jgi:hypothetical protein
MNIEKIPEISHLSKKRPPYFSYGMNIEKIPEKFFSYF